MTTLYVRETAGYRAADSQAILRSAQGVMARRFRKGAPVFSTSSVMREYLQVYLGDRDREVFGLLYLDCQHRLIEIEDLFCGTLDEAPVYPREIIKRTLERNAAAVLCYHNHPSGALIPSPADELMTRKLKEVLALVDVRLIDHLIVGDGMFSFAEAGLL